MKAGNLEVSRRQREEMPQERCRGRQAGAGDWLDPKGQHLPSPHKVCQGLHWRCDPLAFTATLSVLFPHFLPVWFSARPSPRAPLLWLHYAASVELRHPSCRPAVPTSFLCLPLRSFYLRKSLALLGWWHSAQSALLASLRFGLTKDSSQPSP